MSLDIRGYSMVLRDIFENIKSFSFHEKSSFYCVLGLIHHLLIEFNRSPCPPLFSRKSGPLMKISRDTNNQLSKLSVRILRLYVDAWIASLTQWGLGYVILVSVAKGKGNKSATNQLLFGSNPESLQRSHQLVHWQGRVCLDANSWIH